MISIKSICREEGGSKEKDGGSKKKLEDRRCRQKKTPLVKKDLQVKHSEGQQKKLLSRLMKLIHVIYI